MSNKTAGSVRLPLNVKGLRERMVLRTELMSREAELRNFGPLRDRLLASGKDASAKYREIQAQRDKLQAELKKITPPKTRPTPLPIPAPQGPGALTFPIAPIAPLRLIGPGISPWFGYSGSVQMGAGQEGDDMIPPAGVSGSLDTGALLSNGSILFTGDPATSAKAAIWLHNWNYLVCFPAPAVTSVLTYSFGVGVQLSIDGGQGSGTFLSFIALGETANFTGQELSVNNDGFPLVSNFDSAVARGTENVQRSLLVNAGQVPALALVMGIALALSPNSEILFSGAGSCFICPAATIDPSMAVGPTAQRGLINFHYEPLPPELLP